MTENYQKQLDNIINALSAPKKLTLHSCCAPCSSYVIEYLSNYFDITVLFYNPNIDTKEEYNKRAKEQQRLIAEMPLKNKVKFICLDYDAESYNERIKGLEKEKEGGARCYECFDLRLAKTAQIAKEQNSEYFATTLTISPLKNAKIINTIGNNLSQIYDIAWLPNDFKKLGGYQRSIELSKIYNLYRQNYCGCIHSKKGL
ncbi:MAG: epoxyqueuosine reductase QueH [Clostridiales bacterium]|nr:epoxyqueuosine reductase QueH [Clostridiales bacterium]